MRVQTGVRVALLVVTVGALAASVWNLYSLAIRVDEEHRSPSNLELVWSWGALGLSLVLALLSLIAVFARPPRSRKK